MRFSGLLHRVEAKQGERRKNRGRQPAALYRRRVVEVVDGDCREFRPTAAAAGFAWARRSAAPEHDKQTVWLMEKGFASGWATVRAGIHPGGGVEARQGDGRPVRENAQAERTSCVLWRYSKMVWPHGGAAPGAQYLA